MTQAEDKHGKRPWVAVSISHVTLLDYGNYKHHHNLHWYQPMADQLEAIDTQHLGCWCQQMAAAKAINTTLQVISCSEVNATRTLC